MRDIIFQASDLANKRTEILESARQGLAQIRDKDSTSLVMLPERRLRMLEEIAKWSLAHMRLDDLLRRDAEPSIGDLGDLAWLRVFDVDDLREFVDELHSALIAAHSDQDASVLDEFIRAWRITARQLEDPLRRSVLLGRHNPEDFSEASPPQ
ncbi:hypothetical protein [Sphaerisporangium sp. TRM90804]|uniref:hypothetical protein n=1 Tax=Sphaerisporangium sp. TRM90804 TaxID=3031113 RepID=UPI00244C1CAE|nr:hypothetical protein [Sphaerisporangium sp. TRM90804]MDH2425394.1 hypothetical protein [Sphaerisporangium sp. TRM90804]